MKESGEGVYGEDWREEIEGGNDVIIISKLKGIIKKYILWIFASFMPPKEESPTLKNDLIIFLFPQSAKADFNAFSFAKFLKYITYSKKVYATYVYRLQSNKYNHQFIATRGKWNS